jgi:hypothetical protein
MNTERLHDISFWYDPISPYAQRSSPSSACPRR